MALESDRVVNRLRSLGPARLTRADERGVTPHSRCQELAQQLANLAAQATGRSARPVPDVPAQSAADQVAVMVFDLLEEGQEADWEQATATLVDLRRSL